MVVMWIYQTNLNQRDNAFLIAFVILMICGVFSVGEIHSHDVDNDLLINNSTNNGRQLTSSSSSSLLLSSSSSALSSSASTANEIIGSSGDGNIDNIGGYDGEGGGAEGGGEVMVLDAGNTIVTTTIRPLIVPHLPEYHHRNKHQRLYQSKHHHENHWGPFFEEPNNTSGIQQIGIHLGTDATLNCRVGMLRDKTVMWIRKTNDKVSLLTVGNNTYSGDPRINVKFQYPNNWRLHMSPVERDDAGLYMCQVSTHPPRVFATNVTVLPRAIRLVDEHGHEVHDRFYRTGSVIDITCQISVIYLSILPSGLFDRKIDYYHKKLVWLKDGKLLPNNEINLKFNLSSTTEWRNIRLTISHAERTHSGLYTCTLLNTTTAAIVNVQILNDETPAAVQHNSSYSRDKYLSFVQGFFIIFISLILSVP